MNILGISAYYHDSAACLIVDGVVVAAAQEERFTRKKHDSSFPFNAIKFCLEQAGYGDLSEIDYVVFYDKPFLKFERLLETYLAFAPHGFKSFAHALPIWLKDKLFQKNNIVNELEKISDSNVDWNRRLLFSEHHLSHAASAFYPSPFEDAAILTMDGVGEWATTSLAIGSGIDIDIKKEINFPHSLGLLYSAVTYYTGFKVNSGEYKVMGLAPYGKPIYADVIKEKIIKMKDDGSFHLDMSYFNYCTGLTMTSEKFHDLFGGRPRSPNDPLTQKEMDLASSIQMVLEDIVLSLCKSIAKSTSQKNLCLAGGVALNCVANGKLLRAKYFENIWIQPASGDAGGAVGAALAAYHKIFRKSRVKLPNGQDGMRGTYLGPEFSNPDIELELTKCGAVYEMLGEEELLDVAAHGLASGLALGWHQGRMEFGPRSLGARSILCDPRSPLAQKQLNLKIKYRESFRPFAPAVLREDVSEWFELDNASPYMLFVANVNEQHRFFLNDADQNLFGIDKLNIPRSTIPAVTHVDYSARIQTVDKVTNPVFWKLIKRFKDLTQCPVLVNTSFNVRGEPIVMTPSDAFKCFMGTELDMLIIGNYVMKKNNQNPALKISYEGAYELD